MSIPAPQVEHLQVTSTQPPIVRVGILLGDLKKINLTALKYLLLSLNVRQRLFEYEFLPCDSNDPFLRFLSEKGLVNRKSARDRVQGFVERHRTFLSTQNSIFKLQEEPPDYFILITMVKFDDNYYSMRKDQLSVLALGNWERSMAPPSILEFLLSLTIRETVAAVSKRLGGSIHLGTKGCLFDFTRSLDEVKFKVLHAFVCDYCRAQLQAEGFLNYADELVRILDKEWLGRTSNPKSPAGVISKLGFDLFTTRGLEPTFWENCLRLLRRDGVKEVIKVIGGIVLAALLLFLGLKAGGKE